MVYGAGVLFVLLVLLPFWLYLFRDRYQSHPVLLSDDTATLTISEASRTNVATPVFEETRPAKSSLDQFHGVQLDASRDDLQQRFPLRLRNTLGMEPEIYDAHKAGDAESMTAYFYKNGLKEFSMPLTADLLALTEGRSTLFISHRLIGLERVDEIVVLDAGQIVERGTHTDLLTAGGRYAGLWWEERMSDRPVLDQPSSTPASPAGPRTAITEGSDQP